MYVFTNIETMEKRKNDTTHIQDPHEGRKTVRESQRARWMAHTSSGLVIRHAESRVPERHCGHMSEPWVPVVT